MSPLIFTTAPDWGYDVEIGGVGTLGAFGKGGIPVDHAARSMRELQDDDGAPLTPKKLERAAREFAERRNLRVRSVANLDPDDPADPTLEKLRVEAGAFPRGKSAREVSEEYGAMVREQVEAHQEGGAPLTMADVPPQETQQLPETPPTQEA